MITIYSAVRCPYAARARIVLAEKGVGHELVEIDLDDRPAWLYEKNELGRVPTIEEDGFLLPESPVIMEYLEERFPEPPLLPASLEERAQVRLLVHRFDHLLGNAYYKVYRGDDAARPELDERLARLDGVLTATPYLAGAAYTLADVAFVPWVLRARQRYAVDLSPFPGVLAWIDRLALRPAVAAEIDAVAAL